MRQERPHSSGVLVPRRSPAITTFVIRRQFKSAESEVPLEKVYGEWPVSTDAAPHSKTVTELFRSSATIVNIHTAQADRKRVIEFYGKEALPHVKAA